LLRLLTAAFGTSLQMQCLEFTAGIGGTADSDGGAASAEFDADDPSLHLAANFAVMHNAAIATVMW
jgi:hypothetical protein